MKILIDALKGKTNLGRVFLIGIIGSALFMVLIEAIEQILDEGIGGYLIGGMVPVLILLLVMLLYSTFLGWWGVSYVRCFRNTRSKVLKWLGGFLPAVAILFTAGMWMAILARIWGWGL